MENTTLKQSMTSPAISGDIKLQMIGLLTLALQQQAMTDQIETSLLGLLPPARLVSEQQRRDRVMDAIYSEAHGPRGAITAVDTLLEWIEFDEKHAEALAAGNPPPSPFSPLKIYVASSWRNLMQQGVVHTLRAAGYDPYDFKNPDPQNRDKHGFHWSEIGAGWKSWTLDEYCEALDHEIAREGFARDMDALKNCDACVLVLPCGRSAHLEAGYAVGAGIPLVIFLSEDQFEPELMYLMADAPNICTSLDSVLARLEEIDRERRGGRAC